ncbi:Ivy family c-type lysozyme inhibitor [Pseudomonas aeruginosa]
MQTPSKYATYRWYGEPSRQVRELADETVGERSELEVTPGLRVTRPGGGEGG